MGRYIIIVEKKAKKELANIYKSGNKVAIATIEKIFKELEIHPESGIGKPEKMKYQLSGFWSRRINSKDRLIYSINNSQVIVTVLSAQGHYYDK
ncbi:Txe/YoeB family addiction module toxin [Flavobacterium sp. HSC-61S13]|uniref:Txe/YoeB family addiction module toxin n=1 Tax=Flavobacterium sp. HSC-61S13 TaxID=2910963 RepID=UPI00209DEB86|nr:Txe/YoeB family addiction module toxin [Flavobacterium sp. HSC-61S13]MCP1997454.1 toxin YoeB [Flavobacterium sp. HSC-61S13]